MARPRKPTKILQFTGAFDKNPQRGAARKHEPKIAPGIGEIPEWLDAFAREEWARVVPYLDSSGVTSRVESAALGCYCQAVSRLRKAEAEILRDGITIMTETGLKKHPAVTISNEAMDHIRAFGSQFGMTPASRSKVSAHPDSGEKAENEFAAI